MNLSDALTHLLSAFSEHSLYYLFFAAPLFLFFWVLYRKQFKRIRIQEQQRAGAHHFRHDLFHSLSSMLVFAVLDVFLIYFESKGYTLLYYRVEEYGWTWTLLSLPILLFVNDTFFYWSHRLMHHPKLYSYFHRIHHESTDPSPLTAFAFHPSEAIVEYAMGFLLPFIMPMHLGVIITWQLFDMLNNVLGHLGYEVYPRGWVRFPILKFKTASIHHNMHHQLFHGNYALYFTWWDKWMGTEFPDYERKHDAIFQRNTTSNPPEDGFIPLRIAEIREEPNHAFTFRFTDLPKQFRHFQAGQHLTLRVPIGGKTFYRTFSISSVPGAADGLTVTIKRIPGGQVTPYLADHFKANEVLYVSPPSGQFVHEPRPKVARHYLMIAGGSGITPIHSMIGSILKHEPQSTVHLLYANRKRSSVLFGEQLADWQQQHTNRLVVAHFFSDESVDSATISSKTIQETLSGLSGLWPECYLCGPPAMMDQLEAALLQYGVPAELVHREHFSKQAAKQVNATGSMAIVTANLYGNHYQFTAHSGQSILESALQQSIPLPYACKSGLCGMCKLHGSNGTVQMGQHAAISEAERQAGFILTCQAMPQTERLQLQTRRP